MDEESNSRDRLSELPEPLILSILSLLETKEVVGTNLLSKRWNGLWTTVPCLEFNGDPDFPDEFRNLVNGALAVWRGTKIVKFKLAFMFELSLTSHLDSWLLLAILKNVEELYLNLICKLHVLDFVDRDYYPPQLLYSCSSITKLTLVSCKLKIQENVQWDQLVSLTIEGSESLTGDTMDQILSGSPQLEELYLQIMDTSENFNIRSSSLKKLKIERYQDPMDDDGEASDSALAVWAPNLETFKILWTPFRRCLLDVPSLNHAILGFYKDNSYKTEQYLGDAVLEEMVRHVFLSLHHVKKITLSYWCIKVLFEIKKKARLLLFPDVKFLKIYVASASEILGVVEMFPNMTMLVVRFHNMLGFYYSHINCPASVESPNVAEEPPFIKFDSCNSLEPSPSLLHLKTVDVAWHLCRQCDTSIFPFIEIILGNVEMLKQMVFRLVMFTSDPEFLCVVEEKILSIRRSSPTAEVIVCRNKLHCR